ncbi:MAG: DUF2330 domain-containing protein [Proteobacteria bacterium]|nr:DUF2330 domain-containing protein [Pseudomonadota bacterium]
MKRFMIIAVAVASILSTATASADRGSIPFRPHVKIFEPNQRAIIAWNGYEQILILSTDLHASAPTKVLEILPLPSKPQVTKSSIAVFHRLTDLINARLRPIRFRGGPGRSAMKPQAPAARVVFHKKIGAHDIRVFQVLDGRRFVRWVSRYLRSQGVKNVVIPGPLRRVVNEYLADGFRWFVFDVVSLGRRPRTNDAIQYRFATRRLYYPMRITRTESGWTTVDLIVLTPRPLRRFPGISIRKVQLRHRLIEIAPENLTRVSRDLAGFFGTGRDNPNLVIRIWRIRGKLSAFDHDLIAY